MIPSVIRHGGTGDGEAMVPAVASPGAGDSWQGASSPNDENQAIIAGQRVPVVGDHAEHLRCHARFAMTPLGRALNPDAAKKLKDHMRGHVAAACSPGRPITDWDSAAEYAKLFHGYEDEGD